MSEIPFLEALENARAGGPPALAELFTSFYGELHRRARHELRQGTPVTMGPTTLLHETFLNISPRGNVDFADHRKFIAYAASAMRGLIIDHFRTRASQKRGGALDITSLPSELSHIPQDAESRELVLLGDALESLAATDSRLAECVDLKFFCGLSFGEIAELREVSERTVQRDWDKARLLLTQLMREQPEVPQPA